MEHVLQLALDNLKLCCCLMWLSTCTGVVEISPSSVVPVCQAGDQLHLTCTSSGTFHRWEFTVFPESMTYPSTPVTSAGTSGVSQTLTISSSTITFSRLSAQDSSPLISRVVVGPVSSGLNGTVVNCFEGISWTESVATTVIRIIDSQQFGKIPQPWEGCTVLLQSGPWPDK